MKFYAKKLFTKKFYRSSIEKVDKTNEKEWKIKEGKKGMEKKDWKKEKEREE